MAEVSATPGLVQTSSYVTGEAPPIIGGFSGGRAGL